MERLIQKIDINTEICFDRGAFDNWCVYIKKRGQKFAPKDIDYFEFFLKLSQTYGNKKIYSDFINIYDLVTEKIDKKVLALIINFAKKDYAQEISREVAINFIVIYAGMIAERNKKHAVLKERIKRLGMHQILILNMNPSIAVNFSKGKKAIDLNLICEKLGF